MANKVPYYYDPEEFKNWVQYSERCGELELDILRLSSVVEVVTMERDKEQQHKEELLVLLSSRDDEISNTQLMLLEDVREALRIEHDTFIAEKVQLRCRITELEEEVALLEEDNSFLHHEEEKAKGYSSDDEIVVETEQLQELQTVIGQLTSNWRLAMINEKSLSEELAQVRLHRDALSDRLGMFEEDSRIWEIHRNEFLRARNELLAQRDSLQELPMLKLQYKQTQEENASLKRLLKEKISEIEKCREEVFLRSTQMEFMRKHYVQTKEEIEESVSLQQAEYALRAHKYELLKQKYKALRENLSIAIPLISAFGVSLGSIQDTQMRLFRKLRSFSDQESQFASIREELRTLKKASLEPDSGEAVRAVEDLEEELEDLSEASAGRCLTEEFEDTEAKVGGLLEKLQSKDFFVISPEDEFSPTPYDETAEMSLRGKVIELESEVARLRTEQVAFKSRSETLDQVEKMIIGKSSRTKDIVKALEEALGWRVEARPRIHSQQIDKREDNLEAEST